MGAFVTLVEVTGPDGKKTHDLAVLDRDEAGLLADQGLDIFRPAGAVRVDGHDGVEVPRLGYSEVSHGRRRDR
jgi:hypothetical protein